MKSGGGGNKTLTENCASLRFMLRLNKTALFHNDNNYRKKIIKVVTHIYKLLY